MGRPTRVTAVAWYSTGTEQLHIHAAGVGSAPVKPTPLANSVPLGTVLFADIRTEGCEPVSATGI